MMIFVLQISESLLISLIVQPSPNHIIIMHLSSFLKTGQSVFIKDAAGYINANLLSKKYNNFCGPLAFNGETLLPGAGPQSGDRPFLKHL